MKNYKIINKKLWQFSTWKKYNDNISSKVQVLVNKELKNVKEKIFIDYVIEY